MNLFRILLAANVKRVRNLAGLTQQELAEKCNISTNYIATIETGKKFPSAESLEKIAKALKLKPYQLFLAEDDISAFGRKELLDRLLLKTKNEINDAIEKVYSNFR